MNRDEFFSKVDTKLSKENKADAASLETAAQDREFIKRVVAKLKPVAVSYHAKLKERGLNAGLDSSATGITITLRYKDGCRDELYVGGMPNSCLLELNTSYIENTQTYAATKSFNSDRWQDEYYEDRLQRLIENFLLYADKHGGT